MQRHVQALEDGQPGAPNGQRRIGIDDVGDLVRPLQQPVVLDDLADQPELVGALCAHPLVLAHQRHPQRDRAGQHPRHPDQFAAGHQADADVRVEEGGLLGRDHDVGRRDPIHARAATDSVHRGQHRLGHGAKRRRPFLRGLPLVVGRQVRPLVDHLAVFRDLLDVGARAERAAGAGDDEQPHPVVVLRLVVGGPQFGDHVRAERVEGVRAVQGDGRGVPVDLVLDRVERINGHESSLRIPAPPSVGRMYGWAPLFVHGAHARRPGACSQRPRKSGSRRCRNASRPSLKSLVRQDNSRLNNSWVSDWLSVAC